MGAVGQGDNTTSIAKGGHKKSMSDNDNNDNGHNRDGHNYGEGMLALSFT
jgi:hypothetical protein